MPSQMTVPRVKLPATKTEHFPHTGQVECSSAGDGIAGLDFVRNRVWLFSALILVFVALAYLPAWHAGFVWDDDAHVTPAGLRSVNGLFRIWFSLGSTQQYYPLTHTVTWLEYFVFGENAADYHLVNITLHGINSVLLFQVLRILRIRSAFLAAAIFALHPVMVESVAWITEIKNTLAAAFYLGSTVAYLKHDESRGRGWYWCSLLLFVAALLSKSVTATLPGGLLVVLWWKRGRLALRSDVAPLLPFFLTGAAMGLFTSWIEWKYIGAHGSSFDLNAAQRVLIASRAICFYTAKLAWPANLIFIYPRWTVSATQLAQYIYPALVVLLVLVGWLIRRRTRAPLAAMLYFIGTLSPILGAFNVFLFVFSFVADHLQYFASIGLIMPFAAGITWVLDHRVRHPFVKAGCCGVLLCTLALLTSRQCRIYKTAQTLYEATLAKNPDAWMPHNNLAELFTLHGRYPEAIFHLEQALRVKPDFPTAHYNLGIAYAKIGRLAEAVAEYQEALREDPTLADAENNLGNVLLSLGQTSAAIPHFNQALGLKPKLVEAGNNLGNAYLRLKDPSSAIDAFQHVLELKPDSFEAHNNLAIAYVQSGDAEKAILQYDQALKLNPDFADAHYNLAGILAYLGKPEAAIGHYKTAIELRPDFAQAHGDLGFTLLAVGRADEGTNELRRALSLQPNYAGAREALARLDAQHQ